MSGWARLSLALVITPFNHHIMKLAKLPNGEPEIFYTLQGEGISTGIPSVFIRLSMCNLQCTWCDTPYTWNWEGTSWETTTGEKFKKEEVILDYSIPKILERLNQFPCQHLIITGGEPLIQQNEIAELLEQLPPSWTIEVETNGTLIPEKISTKRAIQFNVSLKLPHSGNSSSKALKPESIQWFANNDRSYFKFVISAPEDLAFIQELQNTYNIPASRIILMPEGVTSKKLHEQLPSVAELCIQHGYRLSDRLHVHIWGSERAK